MSFPRFTLRQLARDDITFVRKLNAVFSDAFAEPETYSAKPPSETYLKNLLAKEHIVVLVALAGEES
jgi:aminoglycoside 3-N-acetyltransferase I